MLRKLEGSQLLADNANSSFLPWWSDKVLKGQDASAVEQKNSPLLLYKANIRPQLKLEIQIHSSKTQIPS